MTARRRDEGVRGQVEWRLEVLCKCNAKHRGLPKHLAADGPYQVSGKVTVAVVRCLVAGDGQEKAARAFCYEYRDECAGGLEMLMRGRGTGAGRGG